MALVNEQTPVTTLPELDLYSKAPVQTSIESTYSEDIRPLAQLNTGGHIEFSIHNGLNEYVRLNETTLYVRFRVLLSRADNTTVVPADWDKVSIVNNLLHSLWSQIDLAIGDSQTTSSLQTYPYRAYFETLLGSTPHGRNTYLQAGNLFTNDDMSSDKRDKPQVSRIKYIKPAKVTDLQSVGCFCELEGKLHLDMFLQQRALIGGTKLKIRLIPQRQEFYFMTTGDERLIPRIHFEDVHLNVCKCRVSQDLLHAQLEALNVSPAKYILNRSEVRSVTIDSGASSRNIENVINGKLPRRVYLAFVDNDAYTGSYTKNPYVFNHNNISSLTAFVNGEQYPRRAYTPDFINKKVLREYLELYRVSDQFDNNARMAITQDNFLNGYTIFAFNLSSDLTQGYEDVGYVNLPREGVLRFEIRFASALSNIVNALIFCEFDNQLSIGEDKNAYMDYR